MTTSNRPAAGNRMTRLDCLIKSYPDASLDFIRTSFYLPVDVLQDSRYQVEKIVVTSGENYKQVLALTSIGAFRVVGEGATPAMLKHAKYVGISMRTIRATNEKIMIAKLWYGSEAVTV